MSGTQQLQTTTNLNVQSGNRLVVEFGGTQIGLIQSARLNDSYNLEDASGIGDIHVIEHVPTKATHTVSVQNLVLLKGGMMAAGVYPENGNVTLLGLVFNIVVYSKDTGQAIRTVIGCSYDSGDTDISANRVTMQSGTFKALDVTGTGL